MDQYTYINILNDTLKKKIALLEQLIDITLLQEKCITVTPPDMEQFEQTFSNKDTLIDRLNKLDDGFEYIYDHVKEELSTNLLQHKDEVLQLQELIRWVTDMSTKLQTIEIRNKNKIEIYFAGQKKEIKEFKHSSKSVSNYYKSMSNGVRGESFFLDKKN